MRRLGGVILLALGVTAGAAGGYWYDRLRAGVPASVALEIPNSDGRLKVDMYADVVFQAGASEEPAIAVPTSAVIDSGTRQVVLVAKGEGRFEPRAVKLGHRGDGYGEVHRYAPAAATLQNHYPQKTEGECRTIIVDRGLLYPKKYQDPVEYKERSGLYVAGAKRPGTSTEV